MKLLQKLFRRQQKQACQQTGMFLPVVVREPSLEEVANNPIYWAERGFMNATSVDRISIIHPLHPDGPCWMLGDVAKHLFRQAFPGMPPEAKISLVQDYNEPKTVRWLNDWWIEKSGLTVEELQTVFLWRKVKMFERNADVLIVRLPPEVTAQQAYIELMAGIAERMGIHRTLRRRPGHQPMMIFLGRYPQPNPEGNYDGPIDLKEPCMKLHEKFALAATTLTAAVSTSLLLYTHFHPPRPCELHEMRVTVRIDRPSSPDEDTPFQPFLPSTPPLRVIRLRGAAP